MSIFQFYRLSENIIIGYYIWFQLTKQEKTSEGIKLTRAKTKKFRGSMTHGRGKKGGRGAGLRGGRGNAGLSKHKYMYMTKNMPDHFGRHGFKRPQSILKKDKTINVGELEEIFPGKKDIDLTNEGYDKLLGAGNINSSLKIKVKSASQKAIDKIAEKGGDVKTNLKKYNYKKSEHHPSCHGVVPLYVIVSRKPRFHQHPTGP